MLSTQYLVEDKGQQHKKEVKLFAYNIPAEHCSLYVVMQPLLQ